MINAEVSRRVVFSNRFVGADHEPRTMSGMYEKYEYS